MFYVRLALAVLGFVAASVYGVAIAVLRRDRSRVAYDYAQMLVRATRPALGLRVRVVGRERMLQQRPCVYVANHQSSYDVPVLAELYPPDTVVIGKKELLWIPFFGWLFKVTGNVLIDRKDNPSAVGRLREAEIAILERRVSVWIFPEGTRGRVPGQLLPFKKGAFYMAVAAGVPIVPVVVSPLKPVFDPERRRLRPGTVEVRVLEPVSTSGRSEGDVVRLLGEVWERMQAELTEMAAQQGILPAAPGSGPGPALERVAGSVETLPAPSRQDGEGS